MIAAALRSAIEKIPTREERLGGQMFKYVKLSEVLDLLDTFRNTHETSDVLDAAKWRALRNCARITAIGSAGMGPERAADDYAHITLNFWTGVPDGDPGPAYAREWLDTFVDKALRGSLKANSCVCGEPNSPGTHRTDGPCLAPIGDHHP